MKPLTLRGTRFLVAEKVRLTVVVGSDRLVGLTTANSAGPFVQRFSDVTDDRCNRLLAVAIGSRGSRASIKPFQPACPVPVRGS